MGDFGQPFVTISSSGWRNPATPDNPDNVASSADSTYGSSLGDPATPPATHDISRVNYHVKRLPDFAKALEDSAARAFPNRGSSQRYKHVYALMLHWDSDDLFVLPELMDLEACFSQDYDFETERFMIPSDNAHLDLMLKIGTMIKEHESNDTLLIVYYGGHARIDDSRQSTWCATRQPGSPWLQWSAIQTLLERSLSDALILLDCCAGAASAAFPTGNSITETISASSWDAIAPDPGRYSFTSTLIDVLQEWKRKTFSACMLHAEILARLKHPRPERRNGSHVETRTTPVHFMMTANHRAPSIELCRTASQDFSPPLTFPQQSPLGRATQIDARTGPDEIIGSEPNENVPHVMVSLALEDDQNLNIEDWEQWLANIPALAKYVKVQGVFKSHSTLLLLSLPVMVWDMLPEHRACNFIAFIRSNNLASEGQWKLPFNPTSNPLDATDSDRRSILSGTTAVTDNLDSMSAANWSMMGPILEKPTSSVLSLEKGARKALKSPIDQQNARGWRNSTPLLSTHSDSHPTIALQKQRSNLELSQKHNSAAAARARPSGPMTSSRDRVSSTPALAPHIQKRLEEYFLRNPSPTVAVKEFLASNLGIETAKIDRWFQQRRDQQEVSNKLQSLRMDDQSSNPAPKVGARMILPGHLNKLLEMFPTSQIVVIDLRSPTEYQRSHIHGAINFRAPASFVSRATMEMIEKALGDDASRSSFNKWYTSKCVVFYDKCVEFPWEAPVAEALFQKFKSKDWPGECFVLKGHYREFSQSFDKYIVGAATSGKSAEYLASLSDVSWEKSKDDHQRYEEWLKLLDDEDRVHTTELAPATKEERTRAMVLQQKTLEVEFEHMLPHLYRQAMARKPDDNWSIKAPMVSHLASGLAKMQEEAGRHGGGGDGSGSGSGSAGEFSSNSGKNHGVDLPAYARYTTSTSTKDFADEKYLSSLQHTQSMPPPHHHQHLQQQQEGFLQAPDRTLHKSSSSTTLKGDDKKDYGRGPSAAAAVAVAKGQKAFKNLIRSGRADGPSGR